jgi:hypothetical protein
MALVSCVRCSFGKRREDAAWMKPASGMKAGNKSKLGGLMLALIKFCANLF